MEAGSGTEGLRINANRMTDPDPGTIGNGTYLFALVRGKALPPGSKILEKVYPFAMLLLGC
jgi:hypothetical protein